MQERNENNGVAQSYVYGLDLVSKINGKNKPDYYLYDGLGSVVGLTNQQGALTIKYSYDEWGVPNPDSKFGFGGERANTYGFTGEDYDQDTTLLYLRARYYIPDVGRFISREPFKEHLPASPKLLPSYIKINSILTTSGAINLGARLIGQLQSRTAMPTNFYQYCKNNPTNFIDLNGRDWVNIILAGVGVAAGVLGTVAVITGAPVLGIAASTYFVVSAVTALASVRYSYYQYQTEKITGGEFAMSTVMSVGAAIPYVGMEFWSGQLIYESAMTYYRWQYPK